MYVAIILILIALGSLIFHLLTPWWSTPIASNWGSMDTTIEITFWITGVVYIAILLFMAYCVYRFRHRADRRAAYEPENKKLELWLTVGTALGVAGLLAPGLVVWDDYITVPEDAAKVEVMGQQWQWAYRYPGADGELGTTDFSYISPDNPFGMNPDDPNGQDDVLIEFGELHLPVNKPVNMLMRSIDVLHDFYVPQFRAKMDMVPGLVTFFWMTPTETGKFDILCAELCGSNHYAMRGYVVVEEESAFNEWLAEQPTYAELRAQAGDGGAPGSDVAALEDAAATRSLVAR